MQKHALQTLLGQALVQVEVAVFVIAHNGMALAGQVDANLVRAPGFDGHLQQGHGRQTLQGARRQALAHTHQRQGRHGIGVVGGGHAHAPLAIGQQVFVQRQVNHLLAGRPVALHQSQVGFACGALAELVLQRQQGGALFCHQQQPGSFTV